MPHFQHAIDHLNSGKLVIIPTETVYGIAADASDITAIEQIFSAKNRPDNCPIQIMTHHIDLAVELGDFSPAAITLAEKFWPGGITIVVKRSSTCGLPNRLFGDLPTIGIRIPDHPITLPLLTTYAKPLAVSSANISGQTPCINAQRAEEIFPHIPVIDGGTCDIGESSTVIDCTTDTPKILRQGSITQAMIDDALK